MDSIGILPEAAHQPPPQTQRSTMEPRGAEDEMETRFSQPAAQLAEATAALQDSRNPLNIVLQGVADAIMVQDPYGRIVYANEAAAQDSGYGSVESLLAAPSREIADRFIITDESGRLFDRTRLPGALALQGAQNPPEVLLRVLRKETGEERWRLVKARPVFDEQGRPQLAINIWHDVTERLRAERTQKFLAQASNILASSLDYETTLATVAQLIVPEIADWCSVDILQEDGSLKQLALTHVDPAKIEWAREMNRRYLPDPNAPGGLRQVIMTGQVEFVTEIPEEMLVAAARDEEHLRIIREVGLKSYMIVPLTARGRTFGTVTLVSAESGRRFGPQDLGRAQDLAQRAALAVDNARLYREAQEAIRIREQFLSIASHELRTPITVIYGYIQVLLRNIARTLQPGQPPPATVTLDRRRVVGNLTKMERETERLTDLVGQLLDVSRLQKGALAITPERMDLAALVASVVESTLLQQEAGDKSARIEIQAELPQTGGVWGRWDSIRLEQVIVNLLNNAFKYSPQGGTVTVRLSVEAAGLDDGSHRAWAHLAICDQGIGIPPEQQKQLFQPFFRATNASTRNYPGLGLGLAICQGIVIAHGGRIWVESAGADRGSAFHVLLPGVELDAG
jgi:PAS domain S-box-containing protein